MKNYPFQKIEKKWTSFWIQKKVFQPDLKKAKKPFYNLMMFPYPSAEGLHVGNMYAFTGSDIYGRFMRMRGNDVFEPIGLDGFGIHSENYAIKIGAHPMKQARVTEKNFYRQLLMIGNGFAWDNRLETYDPEYYRWTQWIFTELFRAGLVSRKKSPVNWCPSCKTVLADEQVISGKCERCDSEVVKKDLEQWFFKTTKYAGKLLDNLDKLDWSEKVKIAQRNWIGRSEGALIKFAVVGFKSPISVFTTRPDTILGATYLVLAPESAVIPDLQKKIKNWGEVKKYVEKAEGKSEAERISEERAKTGVELKGVKAINPVNNMEIPVWVSDYVVEGYGTGAIMAVPAYDERDFAFSEKFGLPVVKAPLIPKEQAIKQIKAKKTVEYRLRDWLISRQRYWGPPIPLVYCEHCAEALKRMTPKQAATKGWTKGEIENSGWIPVRAKDLPVVLPYVKNFRPTGSGESPLASLKNFYEAKCPRCGKTGHRETDVSDTFLDSAWYFLRYPSVNDKSLSKRNAFDPKLTKKWLPVDMYLGGAEHAVLHLLYSRFLTMALKDLKHIDFEEPFTVFHAHGLLLKNGAKISKSKGNVINPDDYIKKFGADAFRMHLMFLGPLEEGGDFRDSGIVGITRLLDRVWNFALNFKPGRRTGLSEWLNSSIKKITKNISDLRYNVAISELMVIMNKFSERPDEVTKKDFETFVLLLAPFAPFMTEEIWQKLGNKPSVHLKSWPSFRESAVGSGSFEMVIQVNGRVRDRVEAEAGIDAKEAEKIALGRPKIKTLLKGAKPIRVIFVEGRLINIVA
ncbi:MAG: leucine--tRNA ligase [Patescibacteria group bacterium]|nr:leucine--tRNA ligase [Patescibacteria group bacterium]MCL5262087.1 leucine--tRNA ligase [Patescibacteria group bacterium]